MSTATQKQIDFILDLADCGYMSQVARVTRVGMTQGMKKGHLTRRQASDIITDLLDQRQKGLI